MFSSKQSSMKALLKQVFNSYYSKVSIFLFLICSLFGGLLCFFSNQLILDIVYWDPEYLNIRKLQTTNCYIKWNSLLIAILQSTYLASIKEAEQFTYQEKRGSKFKKNF